MEEKLRKAVSGPLDDLPPQHGAAIRLSDAIYCLDCDLVTEVKQNGTCARCDRGNDPAWSPVTGECITCLPHLQNGCGAET